ncbi:hypothetical protein BC829DRAFT_443753 [Chytridium lagenaria]|nr:hypothetical protein BC829DRAFT_443753 [Chytridium lagenaria]
MSSLRISFAASRTALGILLITLACVIFVGNIAWGCWRDAKRRKEAERIADIEASKNEVLGDPASMELTSLPKN